jgi:hypothetical protein
MAQQTVIHASHIGAVYVSEEIIAFGTADVERRLHPRVDTATIMAEQAEIEALRLGLRAHLLEVLEGDEFISGDIDDLGQGLHGRRQ